MATCRLSSRVSHTSKAAKTATTTPITTLMIIASLFWKPSSQGDTISPMPARRMNHSYHTAKAASAAIDRTAMMMPTMDAVCHCAP